MQGRWPSPNPSRSSLSDLVIRGVTRLITAAFVGVRGGPCPRGDLPTNPTHRFELLAGTLRSQPTIRRCECIGGRPPASRGGHQRLDQLPLGVGQVGRVALVLATSPHSAKRAGLPECVFSVWYLSYGRLLESFSGAASLTAVRTLAGYKRFRRERWGKPNGVGLP